MILRAVIVIALMMAGMATANEPPGSFNRVKIQLAGGVGEPAEGVSSDTYLLAASGYWALSEWWVLELGGGQQWDTFSNEAGDEYDVVARFAHFGGRLLVPTESALTLSAAWRRYRGRLMPDDEDNLRLGYDWGELGLHLFPEHGPGEWTATLRQYWWANDDRLLVVAGEFLSNQAPWAFGLDTEVALDRSLIQVGASINYRF